MKVARRIVSLLFANPVGTAIARRVLPLLDRIAFAVSGGRSTFTGMVEPTLVLETIGAKTGIPRQSALLYVMDGPRFVVAASNFGQPHHPGWSANLLADPDAVVLLGGKRIPVRAQTVDAEAERAVLWAELDDLYAGYARYREVTADIRDVPCSPWSRAEPQRPSAPVRPLRSRGKGDAIGSACHGAPPPEE